MFERFTDRARRVVILAIQITDTALMSVLADALVDPVVWAAIIAAVEARLDNLPAIEAEAS